MNYLAHARLSFDHPGILTGNLISDFVKGRKKFDYPAPILEGINLHRQIDSYTDNHETTRAAKEYFRSDYRLYSGAFVDVVYDHFLARDVNEFPGNSLADFSLNVYATLETQEQWFPEPFARMFPYMKSQNWLLHYKETAGIAKSFNGLVRRSAYLTESEIAFRIFLDHYQRFEECYRQFWADVKPFASQLFEIFIESGASRQ